jgi:hypothetical protein
MNAYPTVGSETDVVFNVHWTCYGTQTTDGKDYAASVYSTCSVPAPTENFTPYEDLTQEQVLGWIWSNGVDKDATEAAVQSQIDGQINPTVVTPPLPWAAA